MSDRDIIRIENLQKFFNQRAGLFATKTKPVKALDGVAFEIRKGETVGLVGESGSGKTTLARILLGLETPTSGSVLIDGNDPFKVKGEKLKVLRRRVGVVFQSPQASLNPRVTIRQSLMRPLILHGHTREDAAAQIDRVASSVNLGADLMPRYPHQLSGGQQQRACIARALLLSPEIMVLDEPTSALDVSVQAQIVNVLLDLQQEFKLTYLFISHDLHLVRTMSDRIVVLYMGRIMEMGSAEKIFGAPAHPYTRALLGSSPPLAPRREGEERHGTGDLIIGEPPSLIDLPEGCRFWPRCPQKREACTQNSPELREIAPERNVSCFYDLLNERGQ